MKFSSRAIAGLTVALVSIGAFSAGASGAVSQPGPTPIDKLTNRMPLSKAIGLVGQAAIIKANSHLPADQVLAAAKDSTAWVDKGGMLNYVEPQGIEVQSDNIYTATASIPTSQAFLLNSRPGSQRVLFLDFDGHLVSNTGWNASYTSGADFYATPWNTEGGSDTFTDNELRQVIAIWQRVAEDYAPFDINITTQDPGDAAIVRSSVDDLNFGTRQVVTNGTNPVRSSCGCGGIAYVGVYNRTSSHSYYNVAFTFNGGVKSAAEAISHEAGHNLGLSHDGTSSVGYYEGHNGWAPIMGVGYYQPLSQWSKGEYPGANQLQDDIQVINNYGGTFASDDHGNTTLTATPVDAGAIDIKGLIGRAADVDVFKLTTVGGTISILAKPGIVSPNLDISLSLLNEAGTVLVNANPASSTNGGDTITGVDASLSTSVPAGTYYLAIDGVGRGDLITGYSDYGSLGYYRITGTVPGTFTVPAPTISSLSPNSGPVGTSVSINGANLTGATDVKFGSSSIPFTSISESRIDIVIPAGAVSSPISVVTAGGEAVSASFTVTLPLPTISSFSPVGGPVGTVVTVNGTNFPANLSGITVSFSGQEVTASYVSGTQLRFTVPNVSGATGHRVSISAPGGSVTSSGTFTIGPRVSSFINTFNNSTTAAVGNLIRLTGDHFIGATAVRLGSLLTSYTVVSDTEITFTVPSSSKTGKISVTANGITFTTSASLTIGTKKTLR